MPAIPLFVVVYRTGGAALFKWHRTAAFNKAEAEAKATEVRRMGFRAMVVQYAQSMAIGLPETFES